METLRQPEKSLGLSSLAFVVTFLAQMGRHQEIHSQIAVIAMMAEVTTMTFAGAAILVQKNFSELNKRLNSIASVGLLVIASCFAAVPATDTEYSKFFTLGKTLKPENWGELGGMWARDARHDLENGLNVILAQFK